MKNILAAVFVLSMISCGDDVVVKDAVELITQSNWKKVNIIDTNDGQELLEDCEKDDVHTFTVDGDYLYNPASDLCGSEIASVDNWSFSPDGEELIIDGVIYPLNKLTEDSLIYTFSGFFLAKYAH